MGSDICHGSLIPLLFLVRKNMTKEFYIYTYMIFFPARVSKKGYLNTVCSKVSVLYI